MAIMEKSVDILIVNWNGKHFCEKLLRQLTALPSFDRLISSVVVVDNGSADGSAEYIASNFPHVKLLALTENLGYAKGNNIGLKMCQAEFVLLLNNDTEINDANFISKLTDYAAANPACGAISPALYLPSGRLQTGAGGFDRGLVSYASYFLFVARIFPFISKPFYFNQDVFVRKGNPVHLDWVSGAAMLVRAAALKRAGGVPEDYFMYAEDVKLCRNLRRLGLSVSYLPTSRLIHVHGGSEDAAGIKTRWIDSTLAEYSSRAGFAKVSVAKAIFFGGFILRAALYKIKWMITRTERDRIASTRMLVYSKAAMAFKFREGKN